ncbi:hypothetical protein [Candidatus Rhodobacter oscarellae]|uniref:hypothetical protein n=1 Tax=Candidatus Rhodobacter oscarellae TaxID=1675527 RepID=UPI000A560EEF|nr:hypothetical protein [Candidatus Rhodobacter lobularis]
MEAIAEYVISIQGIIGLGAVLFLLLAVIWFLRGKSRFDAIVGTSIWLGGMVFALVFYVYYYAASWPPNAQDCIGRDDCSVIVNGGTMVGGSSSVYKFEGNSTDLQSLYPAGTRCQDISPGAGQVKLSHPLPVMLVRTTNPGSVENQATFCESSGLSESCGSDTLAPGVRVYLIACHDFSGTSGQGPVLLELFNVEEG